MFKIFELTMIFKLYISLFIYLICAKSYVFEFHLNM